MLRIILAIVAAVLLLNVLFVGWLAMLSFLQRHRRSEEAAESQTNVRELTRVRALPPLMDRHASRRLIGAVTLVAMLFAGTAFASPRARELAVTMLGSVARGLQIGPTEEGTTRALGAPVGGQAASAAEREGKSASQAPVRGVDIPTPDPISPHGSGTAGETAALAPPARPATVTASSISSSTISVSWTDVGTETGYRVERSSDGVTGWTVAGTTLADGLAFTDDGRDQGTTYYYRVFAMNGGVDSAPSDVVSATTSVDPASPPIVVAAADSSSSILLSWADVLNETGYRVERSADGATGWIAVATTGQGVVTYEDAGLQPGVTYYYRVFATNAGGDSAPSLVVSDTTFAESPSPATEPVLPSP